MYRLTLVFLLGLNCFLLPFYLLASEVRILENLDYENELIKKLRSDVKHNLRVSKSKLPDSELRDLTFYKYKVAPGDNFFRIMSRTGMDIDTISSVNSLSSPQDLQVGMTLLIPNMRGVYESEDLAFSEENRTKLADKYDLPLNIVIYDRKRGEWFIPGRTLNKLEKAFFYSLAFIPPLYEGRLTSGYGHRADPFTKNKTFHGGIDIGADKGTDVIASAEGEVVFTGKKGGYGKLVVIKHILGYETRYGHLSKILATEGAKVKKGEKIGEVGNTGRATGYHLHFEVKRFSKNEKPVFYKHM